MGSAKRSTHPTFLPGSLTVARRNHHITPEARRLTRRMGGALRETHHTTPEARSP
jgi:hypothetical protein